MCYGSVQCMVVLELASAETLNRFLTLYSFFYHATKFNKCKNFRRLTVLGCYGYH